MKIPITFLKGFILQHIFHKHYTNNRRNNFSGMVNFTAHLHFFIQYFLNVKYIVIQGFDCLRAYDLFLIVLNDTEKSKYENNEESKIYIIIRFMDISLHIGIYLSKSF